MSNNNSALDKVLAVGAFVGGAFLVGAALGMFGKRSVRFKCPNCQFNEVPYKAQHCPSCHTVLNWGDE